MASRINADSSNGLQLVSDSSGEVQIQSNGVTVATINSSGLSMNSGTLAGNGPAFSAYNNGTQSVSGSTDTKVVFNTEEFDTNSNYDNTTNYRFTPTVAGYYQFNTNVYHSGAAYAYITLVFYKNGAALAEVDRISYTGQAEMNGSALIYLNGSTDYVEVYSRSQGASITLGASDKRFMNFSGYLVRAV